MLDLNTLFSAALSAAIAEAVKPIIDAQTELARRIDTLSAQDVAMGERIEALDQRINVAQISLINLSERLRAMEAFYPKDSEGNVVTHPVVTTADTEQPVQPLIDRLQLVEDNLTRVTRVLGSMVHIDDLEAAAKAAYEDDTAPVTRPAFDQRLIEAVESNADDFIAALKQGDTDELIGIDVGGMVARAIRDGSFSIEFSSY